MQRFPGRSCAHESQEHTVADTGEYTTPIYVRINGVETEIGRLTVQPHQDATTDLNPHALMAIRNAPLAAVDPTD
jgi:hypothetical protein